MEFHRLLAPLMFVCFSMTIASPITSGRQRWCCTSDHELVKCQSLGAMTDSKGDSLFPFDCVYAEGTKRCMDKIEAGIADLMTLDGGDIYLYKDIINVVAGEDYGVGEASYYAVAVVKRENEEVNMFNLAEHRLKSCHTGIGKTSGWNTPMGWMARRRNVLKEDGTLEIQDPFVESCAPGAMNPNYEKLLPDPTQKVKWCQLCIGDRHGRHVCDRDSDETYYSYSGALLCLSEGAGDIAFVKHTTILESDRDKYSLLCPDGSRAHPSDWDKCNLARVPAHGLVMRKTTDQRTAQQVFDDLEHAMESIPRDQFISQRPRDLLWKSSTEQFIGGFIKTPKDFLGTEYYCNTAVMNHDVVEDECLHENE